MPELTPSQSSELNAKLGKQSDWSLAREYGISRQRVGELRHRKSIPRYKSTHSVNVGTYITEKDERRLEKGMKKTRTGSRSEYMREAIRDKNDKVLGEG